MIHARRPLHNTPPNFTSEPVHSSRDAADVIGFLAEDLKIATDDSGFRERVRATSSNQRFLFVEGSPAFVAKNRYGMAPKNSGRYRLRYRRTHQTLDQWGNP